ncbi:hypothetical protein [Gordonia malaquae]|uniref:hypothetical protein n=1 Tax=Gordonia malaquae TaxID=410332 RepID=UPI003017104A
MTPPANETTWAKLERRVSWRLGADVHNAERIRRRLQDLQARQHGIDRALTSYRTLDHFNDVTELRIRTDFIALPKNRDARTPVPPTDHDALTAARRSDRASRPPLTRLSAIPGSRALPTYLTMLAVAHYRPDAGGTKYINDRPNSALNPAYPSWLELSGLYQRIDHGLTPTVRTRRHRRAINAALANLDEHNLIALTGVPGAAGRYDQFRLLSDNGREGDYTVPGERTPGRSAIRLPAQFFTRGWHLVLTPSEIAMLLALIDWTGYLSRAPRATSHENSVGMPEVVRWRRYGLSREAYASVRMLELFNLVTVTEPMPFRALTPQTPREDIDPAPAEDATPAREENQRETLRLTYDAENAFSASSPFDRPAFDVVTEVLGPLSYALDEATLRSLP